MLLNKPILQQLILSEGYKPTIIDKITGSLTFWEFNKKRRKNTRNFLRSKESLPLTLFTNVENNTYSSTKSIVNPFSFKMKEEAQITRIPTLSSSPSSPSGRLTGLRSFCRPADLHVELGDLIEIDRTIYTHWGLYVGDGEIVHVSGPKSDISSSESSVRRSFLKEVAGDCLVRVNNKEVPAKERGLDCLSLEEILSRSLNSVGQSVPYNFLTKNVEHYVTEWRYGVGWSDQANIALQTMSMFGNTLKDPNAAHHVLVMQINSILNAGHILSPRTESTHGTHH